MSATLLGFLVIDAVVVAMLFDMAKRRARQRRARVLVAVARAALRAGKSRTQVEAEMLFHARESACERLVKRLWEGT